MRYLYQIFAVSSKLIPMQSPVVVPTTKLTKKKESYRNTNTINLLFTAACKGNSLHRDI